MQCGRVSSEDAIHVDIDQHLIVKTVDAVVERSVVKADMYAEGHALGVVAQYRRYATSDSSADLMFSIARYQLLPLWITEEQPNPGPSFRLGDERWNPVRVFFGQNTPANASRSIFRLAVRSVPVH